MSNENEYWLHITGGRARAGREEALEDLALVALLVAERDQESCMLDMDFDRERAEELLAEHGSGVEYLCAVSPAFARLVEGRAAEFPYGLEALTVEPGGGVDFSQDEWTTKDNTRTLAVILSDFLEPGAVVYSSGDGEGAMPEGAFRLDDEGEITTLTLAWVDRENKFVGAV